jgi:hypothetical protein
MRLLEDIAARLARSDMLQGIALLFVALAFTLAIQWPTGAAIANQSWFTVAPVRLTLLAIGALAWGAGLGARPTKARGPAEVTRIDLPGFGTPQWRAESLATLGALLVLVPITLPFELATHAASYPDVSLAWSLGVPLLAVTGYFGAGLLLGRLADVLRVSFLLALLVPLVVAGSAWLDVSLGQTVLNPWTASLAVSVPYAVTLCVLSLVTIVVLTSRSGHRLDGPADRRARA